MLSKQPSKNSLTNKMRLLHTMFRVNDLSLSIKFYTEVLSMKLLRKTDYSEGEFSLAFLGYGDEANTTVLELTYNWTTSEYERGNAFGHIAIAVRDIYEFSDYLRNLGIEVIRPPGPMKADGSEIIAFIKDPDGYQIELIERE